MANGVAKAAAVISPTQNAVHGPSSRDYIQGVVKILERLPFALIDRVAAALFEAYQQDSVVYLFGNGGSAALASHAACDLGKGTTDPGRPPFRVVSLTDNVSLITAWANDTSYDNIFAAQLRPFVKPRDIVFAISGSGNSANVLRGLQIARDAGAFNIGLTGFEGGKMASLCDCCIIVPCEHMQRIEDSHLCIMHAIFLAFRRRVETSLTRD